MRKKKKELKNEDAKLREMSRKLMYDGLKEGTYFRRNQVGFTKEGNLIVNLYDSDVCYDLTANKEVTKEVVEPKYKTSNKAFEKFRDSETTTEAYKLQVISAPGDFMLKLSELIEIAQNEKNWKKEEQNNTRTHEQEIMNRMKEMIEATYGKLY